MMALVAGLCEDELNQLRQIKSSAALNSPTLAINHPPARMRSQLPLPISLVSVPLSLSLSLSLNGMAEMGDTRGR